MKLCQFHAVEDTNSRDRHRSYSWGGGEERWGRDRVEDTSFPFPSLQQGDGPFERSSGALTEISSLSSILVSAEHR